MKRSILNKLKIGQRITLPCTAGIGLIDQKMTGTVVYIHPESRFFTVEFRYKYGKFRESYIVP